LAPHRIQVETPASVSKPIRANKRKAKLRPKHRRQRAPPTGSGGS